MKMPITHNLVETSRQYWKKFFAPSDIKTVSRITAGSIEGLVDDYFNLIEKGEISIRLNPKKANSAVMYTINGDEIIQMKSPKGNIVTRRGFDETIENYLLRNCMYLAQVNVKRDWRRGFVVNGWPSYRMTGYLYERIR